eukprot:TRINITY_DN111427_c0_g1_i1.p3 TRINITY_DN111427_c0_g1~~TRINITY_DN111427_c0_g1_i1.p3  ORF type:complete len:102 (-),score=20.89 TRINITY_DN111427_c0_g1_i1:39-344(-)
MPRSARRAQAGTAERPKPSAGQLTQEGSEHECHGHSTAGKTSSGRFPLSRVEEVPVPGRILLPRAEEALLGLLGPTAPCKVDSAAFSVANAETLASNMLCM